MAPALMAPALMAPALMAPALMAPAQNLHNNIGKFGICYRTLYRDFIFFFDEKVKPPLFSSNRCFQLYPFLNIFKKFYAPNYLVS
jgi:hypothetical protein